MTELFADKVLSVSELTHQVKFLLEEAFPVITLGAEISGLSRPASGHIYLTLKDANAQISSVIYRGTALRIPFDLRNGLDVIVRGKLTVYPPRGSYQFMIEDVQPKGIGAAELALRQLKEKLQKLGYFATERKRPLPSFPKRIAVVTSPTGAAIRDILETLRQRWLACEVWVLPVRVQGEGSAEEIARALLQLNSHTGVDLAIVGRGGGSSEDLSSFNDERVARAIFESRIPIVSAVGHEIDVTIADLVADHRALTPTAAAQMVVPHRDELREYFDLVRHRARQSLVRIANQLRQRVTNLSSRACFRLPFEVIRARERRLDDLEGRIHRAARQHLAQLRERFLSQAARLGALSPLNVLARGYSLTRREKDMVVVRLGSEVVPGSRLVTDGQHARVTSVVTHIEPVDRRIVPRPSNASSSLFQN
ncbi:exodeoxyribonuclease VII large subunit [soil metagenome]